MSLFRSTIAVLLDEAPEAPSARSSSLTVRMDARGRPLVGASKRAPTGSPNMSGLGRRSWRCHQIQLQAPRSVQVARAATFTSM